MKTLAELLTPKQLEIARLIRYGLQNPEIERLLGLTEWAVCGRLKRICERTGCENRTMLAVRYALENQALENQAEEKKPVKRAA